MTIGTIEYNNVGVYFWEIYPALQNGIISFSFTYNNEQYIIEIFYNTMAMELYYNIKNQSDDIFISQMQLAKNINLLCHLDFNASLILNDDYTLEYEIF